MELGAKRGFPRAVMRDLSVVAGATRQSFFTRLGEEMANCATKWRMEREVRERE